MQKCKITEDETGDLFPFNAPRSLSSREWMQQLVGYFYAQKPSALAVNVAIGCGNLKAHLGVFYRNNRKRSRPLEGCAIAMFSDKVEKCFADSSLLEEIRSLRSRKEKLEEEIRCCEPELASDEDLFGEFRFWDYENSRNEGYHKLCKKLDGRCRMLHESGKLELLRESGMVDCCYLAVPRDLIGPEETADGWGLLYLDREGKKNELVKEPVPVPGVLPENRLIFAENMAMAAAAEVAFYFGVDLGGNAKKNVRFRRLPRKRNLL